MATTATEAWAAISEHEQEIARSSGRDGFTLGFTAGWKAQENRPFHCTYCGFECRGATDGESIAMAQDHTKACKEHPLAIENKRLRAALERIAEGCGHVRCHAFPWIRLAQKALRG